MLSPEVQNDNRWVMQAAQPHIYQLHQKDLEYKKRAMLANEKNIFKKRSSQLAALGAEPPSRISGTETPSEEMEVEEGAKRLKYREIEKHSTYQNLNCDSTAGGSNELAFNIGESARQTKVKFDIQTPALDYHTVDN